MNRTAWKYTWRALLVFGLMASLALLFVGPSHAGECGHSDMSIDEYMDHAPDSVVHTGREILIKKTDVSNGWNILHHLISGKQKGYVIVYKDGCPLYRIEVPAPKVARAVFGRPIYELFPPEKKPPDQEL